MKRVFKKGRLLLTYKRKENNGKKKANALSN